MSDHVTSSAAKIAGEPASTPAPTKLAHLAITHAASHARLWVTCALGLSLDLWSKYAAWAAFYRVDGLGRPVPEPWTVAPGLLDLTAVRNYGALFGMGQGMVAFFIVASLAAVGLVLALFGWSERRQWTLHVATGLILAGAFGNFYDRFTYGFVRDFLHITTTVTLYAREIALWPWVFNVADMMLVVGVSVVLLHWNLRRPDEPAPADATSGASSS